MANDKENEVPAGQEQSTIHGSTMGSAASHIAFEKTENPDMLETIPTNVTEAQKEVLKEDLVASLGIDDWQTKEKKIVRTLDMTLLPQLWILYMFVSETGGIWLHIVLTAINRTT